MDLHDLWMKYFITRTRSINRDMIAHQKRIRNLERINITFTSAVKAAAAIKRPFGDIVAIVFLSWFVSTLPNVFPVFPCQSIISVPDKENEKKMLLITSTFHFSQIQVYKAKNNFKESSFVITIFTWKYVVLAVDSKFEQILWVFPWSSYRDHESRYAKCSMLECSTEPKNILQP